jgi:putative transposase
MAILTDKKLSVLLEAFNLPESGRQIVNRIRNSSPARATRGGPMHQSGHFASRKMRLTIQYESRHYESAFIRMWERDKEVLEYWDQPLSIKIFYVRKDGKNHAVFYTPDFFVIWKSKIGFVEIKTEAALAELAKDQPSRYARGEDGRWQSPPCEQYAAEHGLGYWIMTEAEIDRTYLRNIDFLEAFFKLDPAKFSDQECSFIRGHLAATPAMLLSDLIDVTLQASIDTDIIYALIAFNLIYVDLSAAALKESDRVYVFINSTAADLYDPTEKLSNISDANVISMGIGQSILYGDIHAEIVNITSTEIWLCGDSQQKVIRLTHAQFEELFRSKKISGLRIQPESGYKEEVNRILNEASPKELEEGLRRHDLVLRHLAGEKLDKTVVPPRTLYRYVAEYKAGEVSYGSGFVALIPNFHDRGNRIPRFSQEVLDKAKHYIENDYESVKQKIYSHVHGELAKDCEANGLIAPSLTTFIKMAQQRPTHIQVRKRRGHKAANAIAPFSHWLEKDTPRQGDLPFQICHIDHTKLDVTFRCSITGRILGRPWITFMSCANTRILPAVYMTFDPPSYRSCLMVIRECVRRYGRLPQYLVVDGGKEFKSIYFRAFCAFFGIHLISREGKPRHGSTCERLFDTNRRQFANNLSGNTQIMKNVREVSKEVAPETHAVWTLGRAYPRLTEWAYEIYETNDHFNLKQSPREAFAVGIAQTGSREHTKILFDDVFRTLTLPTTRKGTAQIMLNDGVKVNNIYYWSDEFRNPELVGKQVPVRYDPFNMGEAYAYVNGRWITGTSECFWFFQGRTEREMLLAGSEIRRRDQLLNRNRTLTAKRLAEFIGSLEQEEDSLRAQRILLQRSRDVELKDVHVLINGGQSAPVTPLQIPAKGQSSYTLEEPSSGEKASEPLDTVNEERHEQLEELDLMEELTW